MENLLAMPITPLEVMTGKIVPYIAIGLIQATIILLAAKFIFAVPFVGSVTALYGASLLFIACNLTVGITLSSLARNQLQAMQLTFFYFLPNILLSGFMFPFRGNAGVGAVARQPPAAYLLQSPRAGYFAQGQRLARPVAEPVAARGVRTRRDAHRREVLPEDARLMARSSFLAILCALLAGCTVGPDFRAPDPPATDRYLRDEIAPVQGMPRLVTDRDIAAQWWVVFGSPEIDALVQRALSGSPTLDQARAPGSAPARELRLARAGATQYPQFDLVAGAERQRIDPATFGFPDAPEIRGRSTCSASG